MKRVGEFKGRIFNEGSMWRWALSFGLIILISSLAGCDDCDDIIVDSCGGWEPAPPQGAFTVTGNEEVYIYWYPNTEPDLRGYRIYRNPRPDGHYRLIGEVGLSGNSCPDGGFICFIDDQVDNGDTWYYGIKAYDREGLESDFNEELLMDTPRPDGSVTLWNAMVRPGSSGFDFSELGGRVAWDDPGADIFFEYTSQGGYRIYAADEGHDVPTDLQDAGYIDPDIIGWAPADGWSTNGWVEAIPKHTYVIWTRNDRYAKIFINEMTEEEIDLYWAYQLDPGNQELSLSPGVQRAPKSAP
ncbi:MAG: hypothetical protein KJ927_01130 [Candidatus Eisenbacteria bacterium]|nr:hypothetical protein [Candidatus Eisenbacteria bacterium]